MKKIFKIYAIKYISIDDEPRYTLEYVAGSESELDAIKICEAIQTKTADHYHSGYYDDELTILPVYIKS